MDAGSDVEHQDGSIGAHLDAAAAADAFGREYLLWNRTGRPQTVGGDRTSENLGPGPAGEEAEQRRSAGQGLEECPTFHLRPSLSGVLRGFLKPNGLLSFSPPAIWSASSSVLR